MATETAPATLVTGVDFVAVPALDFDTSMKSLTETCSGCRS